MVTPAGKKSGGTPSEAPKARAKEFGGTPSEAPKARAKEFGSAPRRNPFVGIRWGAFTAQFKAYRARHPQSKLKTLRAYAEFVLRQAPSLRSELQLAPSLRSELQLPTRHSLITRKRALFYLNVILKGKAVKREKGAKRAKGAKGAKAVKREKGAKAVKREKGAKGAKAVKREKGAKAAKGF
jgi:hypothetical protein